MSTYEVEYQVHPSQATDDDWIKVPLNEPDAHEWFDRYRNDDGVVAVRVVRVDRTVIRNFQRAAATPEPGEGQ